jgi:hypothetical protein
MDRGVDLMCDICNGKSIEQARMDMANRILDEGMQIIGIIDGRPNFAYSVGRSLSDLPELLVTGTISMQIMQYMINEADRMEREEGIKIEDGYMFAENELLQHYPVKVVAVDPRASEMFESISIGGDNITALQLVWPDMEGNFPGPDFNPKFSQPVRSLA